MTRQNNSLNKQNGFTLVEIAIVMLIVVLLLTGLVPTLSSQVEQRQRNETRKQLSEIRDALLGFAVSNGRLPCPASNTSNGMESFCTTDFPGACGAEIFSPALPPAHMRCAHPYDGLVPAAALGITSTDNAGYALDGWSNRIRYALSTANDTNAYTLPPQPNGMKGTTMVTLVGFPGLSVCASATGINAGDCGAATILTNNSVAVIYSVGRIPATAGADEAANQNADPVFVSHDPSPATAANGEFDDIVTWISPNILFNRMVEAGQLP